MFWTILALSMTVLMGGIIAYNGDLIGRKFGKRRVSMFGLRPKHTAILITSITGVLISAGTTTVLFLLVSPVREVILSGEQALRINRVLKKENSQLDLRIAALKQQAVKEKIQARQTGKQLFTVEANYNSSLHRYRLMHGQLLRSQADIRQAVQAERKSFRLMLAEQTKTHKLVAYNQILRNKNQAMSEANEVLGRQNLSLAEQNHTLSMTNVELKNENDIEVQRNAEYIRANSDLAQQNEQLTRTNTALSNSNKELTHSNDIVKRVNVELIKAGHDLMDENQQLTAENKSLTEENKELIEAKKEFEQFKQEYGPGYRNLLEAFFALRDKHVAIYGGEDLGRTVIPANSSPDVVRQALHDLVQTASVNALTKGASGSGQAQAVQVVDKEFFQRTPMGQYVPIHVTAQERIEAIINRISWQPIPYCIIAMAVANSVDQEPASIDFQPFPNRLIYPQGYLISTKKMNASEPMDKIFTQLIGFLKDLGQEALQRGIIPKIDPVTGYPQVGSLSAADVVNLASEVKSKGGEVNVQAYAEQDIYSADPLKMNFKIVSTF